MVNNKSKSIFDIEDNIKRPVDDNISKVTNIFTNVSNDTSYTTS